MLIKYMFELITTFIFFYLSVKCYCLLFLKSVFMMEQIQYIYSTFISKFPFGKFSRICLSYNMVFHWGELCKSIFIFFVLFYFLILFLFFWGKLSEAVFIKRARCVQQMCLWHLKESFRKWKGEDTKRRILKKKRSNKFI